MPARLTVPGVSSALRFQSTQGKQWLAYYDMDSPDVLKSNEYAVLKEKASDNERRLIPHVSMDRRVYKTIFSVGKQSATPPKTLLVVEMTPYETHVKEFNHWYNTFHIAQVADIEGWTRSRRFELVEPLDTGVCKYLTLHEFDKPNALDPDRARNVKWRNEVIEIVAERARSIWEPYQPANGPSGVYIVNHDGIQFNVKVDGKENAPVIALANPLGFNISIWDKVVAALAPNFRIVRHDQRGHGRTSQPAKSTSFPELTHDLVAILDVLNIPKLHALIGVSMGAIVALDFGLRFPDRVEKLVVCDGQPFAASEGRKARNGQIALIQENGVEVLADQMTDRWFTAKWKQNSANDGMLKKINDILAKTAPKGFIANARAMDNYDYINAAKRLKVPSLLVCGDQDPVLGAMKELEKVIPNGHIEIIEECGHLPMVEQPERFIETLKRFL